MFLSVHLKKSAEMPKQYAETPKQKHPKQKPLHFIAGYTLWTTLTGLTQSAMNCATTNQTPFEKRYPSKFLLFVVMRFIASCVSPILIKTLDYSLRFGQTDLKFDVP